MRLLAAIAAVLIACAVITTAEAHYGFWNFQSSCTRYSVTMTLVPTDAREHRVIILRDGFVVGKRDLKTSKVTTLYTETGPLPIDSTFRAYVYDKVGGSYVYNPAYGSRFVPAAGNGLVTSPTLSAHKRVCRAPISSYSAK